MYEVPYWPGQMAANQRSQMPVTLLDLFPTFLDAAGVDKPQVHEEGESLRILGNGSSNRTYAFSQFSDKGRIFDPDGPVFVLTIIPAIIQAGVTFGINAV